MKCPVCRQRTMYVVEFEGIELDVCHACDGVWFDADELGLLLGRDPVPDLAPAADPGEGERPCPRCRKDMAKANIGPHRRVLVDVCRRNACGLWFDRGELGELAADLAEAGWTIDPAVRRFLSDVFPGTPAGGEAD